MPQEATRRRIVVKNLISRAILCGICIFAGIQTGIHQLLGRFSDTTMIIFLIVAALILVVNVSWKHL